MTGTLAATDVDNDPLTFSVVAQPSKGTVVVTNAATGAYLFTPALHARGSDSFTFKANDGQVDSKVATVSITINPVNHAPVANDGTLTTHEDAPMTGLLGASDIDNDALTFTVVTQASKGVVTITNAATGAFTYTPTLYVNGSDSFTFKANDGQADSNVATVSIGITPVNHAPVASNGSLTTDEDVPFNGSLAATDVDNDPLTFSVVTQPSKGTVVITNAATGAFLFTPALHARGSDAFVFKANDGQVDSNLATVSITLTPVNHAPVASGQNISTLDSVVFSGALQASDVDNDPLTYRIATNGTLGTAVIVNASTGAFMYTPNGTATGADTFTFIVNDGLVDSATATVSVTVAPTAPSFPLTATASGNAREDFTYALTAAGTAPIQFAAAGLPAGLTLDGAVISGKPTSAGTYTVSINATNAGGAASQTLTLVIANPGGSGNTPPQITSPAAASQGSATLGNPLNFSAAATDANGDQLSYLWDFGDGSQGTGATTSHVYSTAGIFTVTVTISDGAASVTSSMLIASNGAGVQTGSALHVLKAALALNFAPGVSKDTLQLSGTLPTDSGFAATGMAASVVVAGKTYTFVLGKTGSAENANQALKIAKITKGIFASTVGTFTLSLKNQALANALKAYGAAGTVLAPGQKITFPVAIDLGGKSYVSSASVLYTAKAGKGKGKTVAVK